jgi:hypothetical protein
LIAGQGSHNQIEGKGVLGHRVPRLCQMQA